MDDFKRAKAKEIQVGGIQCPCCSPIACKDKSRQKQRLQKRARTRLRQRDLKEGR